MTSFARYLIRPRNRSTIKHAVISVFLLVHIVAITAWCVPFNWALNTAFRNVIRPYMLWSGLFQSWDMFAPAPKSIESYVDAVVIYKDGTTRTWAFPRMEQLSFTERYFKERYRKFVENLKENSNVALWPDAARRIARLNNNTSSSPALVILVRHWSDIVLHNDTSDHPQPWHAQIFYEYSVKPKDLN